MGITGDLRSISRRPWNEVSAAISNSREIDEAVNKKFQFMESLDCSWAPIRVGTETNWIQDNDILWLRDPFPNLQDGDVDFHVSSDKYNGNPNDFTNGPNTGIMYVKSNIRTILLFKFWYYSRSMYEGKNDQEVFNKIKKRSFLFEMIRLKVKFLDPTLFGSFCQPSKDFNKVCTMHASCCVGLSHKVHDLKLILDDWRKYSSSSPQSLPHPFQWSAPRNCSF